MFNIGCDGGTKIVTGLASGYSFWEEPIHLAYADMSSLLGAFGLFSTTEDLFIWDKALKSPQLFNEEMRGKMFRPNLGSYVANPMDKRFLSS